MTTTMMAMINHFLFGKRHKCRVAGVHISSPTHTHTTQLSHRYPDTHTHAYTNPIYILVSQAKQLNEASQHFRAMPTNHFQPSFSELSSAATKKILGPLD